MNHNTAKEVAEIVGLGLGANYIKNAAEGHPRDPDIKGGFIPVMAPTGDQKHDMAMTAGRWATVYGLSHWILLPIWKVYAVATGVGLVYLGQQLHIHVYTLEGGTDVWFWVGIGTWLILQILFILWIARVCGGKRVKPPKRKHRMWPRPTLRTRWVTTQIIDGEVVMVETPPPIIEQRQPMGYLMSGR